MEERFSKTFTESKIDQKNNYILLQMNFLSMFNKFLNEQLLKLHRAMD